MYNSQNHNLWGTTASIIAENTVLGSAGGSSFYGGLGGKYVFTHCTLANFWNNGPRTAPTLLLDNFLITTGGETLTADLENADFVNCIVDGTQSIEFSLFENAGAAFNFNFKNCLLTFNDSNDQFADNPLYNFDNVDHYQNNIFQ